MEKYFLGSAMKGSFRCVNKKASGSKLQSCGKYCRVKVFIGVARKCSSLLKLNYAGGNECGLEINLLLW